MNDTTGAGLAGAIIGFIIGAIFCGTLIANSKVWQLRLDINELVKVCEKELPRNQHCKAVITAVVIGEE